MFNYSQFKRGSASLDFEVKPTNENKNGKEQVLML